MILEGIVTTLSADGKVNVAPMGPRLLRWNADGGLTRFLLRPFHTAHTYANLKAHPEGVLHVTDDVLLLARAAIGDLEPLPPLRPADHVRGVVLVDACRYHEFRIVSCDDREPRAEFEAEVVATGRQRDFVGFNRGKHAVVEAAILATRVHLLPRNEIETEFARLAILVDKTGGEQEHAAFELLRRHVQPAGPTTPGG
jgi:hypothetical protein